MRRSPAIAGVLAALVVLCVATTATAQRGSAAMREKRRAYHEQFINKPAPPFALADPSGGIARLVDFRGKVIMLNFWFSTCVPCRQETPALMRLYDAYRNEGLMVIGINLDEILIPQYEGVLMGKFLKTFGVNYPILVADQDVFNAYGGVPVQPTTFLIDRDGVVDRIFWGAFPESAFDMSVRPLLAGEAQPPKAAGAPSGP